MDLKKKIKGFFSMTRKANDGFTLAELIVVIAILAILAGVSVAAYNGYIEKANRAADERLLAVVNRAYAAACVDYGQDSLVTKGFATLQGDAGSKTVKQVTSYYDQTGTSFAKYFADNEDSVFKVFQHLIWKDGVFVNEESKSYNHWGTDYYYQPSDIDAYENSNFAGMGVENTLGLMDNLVTMLQNTTVYNRVEGKWEGPIVSLKEDDDFMAFMAANGLYDPNDDQGPTDAEVSAGFAFYAAERLSSVDPNAIASAMTSNANDSINNMYAVISGGEPVTFSDKALSAAVIYSMTASYAQSTNQTLPTGLEDVTGFAQLANYLTTYYGQQDFKDYIVSSDVAQDMTGLVGVMNTLETNDKNAWGILEEGGYSFANSEMGDLIGGIRDNNSSNQ